MVLCFLFLSKYRLVVFAYVSKKQNKTTSPKSKCQKSYVRNSVATENIRQDTVE